MSEFAIKVENVSKAYTIWRDPSARLKHPFLELAGELFPPLRHRIDEKLKGLCTEYYALRDVSFEVKKGESVGIIGRNGSGKSTLLQIIAGTLQPSSGSVTVNGRVAALLELGSGFNPEFTGRENVYLNCSILGLSKEETDTKFDSIAEFADIGDFLQQPVKTYSSGMAMRLAFAVIAHIEADILIVDEALSVGDSFFIQKCMRFIKEFQKDNILLFVSHSAETINSLCNKAIWLKNGKLEQRGTPKIVNQNYTADLFGRNQVSVPLDSLVTPLNTKKTDLHDMRRDLLISPPLRNDLIIGHLNLSLGGTGSGEAIIQSVLILDELERPLSCVVGGESVIIEIKAQALKNIDQPIIGFSLKNSLGVVVFGDNTYLSHMDQVIQVQIGEIMIGRFHFLMPRLPGGDYMMEAAVANGTQSTFVMLHKIPDALPIKSTPSLLNHGQLAIPATNISLKIKLKQ
jgi:lipopolysaccharide transport system ATP-binding protein